MKHPEPIEEILHQCLQRLDAGEDIASCLRDYPEHHDVLAPLLAVTADVRRLPAPTLPAHVRSAARLRAREVLVRQATAGKQQNIPYRLTMLQRRAVATLLALVLVIGSLGATVAVAQQSLPGDVLYRVKRGSEQLRVQLTPALEERAILYLAAADRRVAEALALLARGSIPSPETIRDIALAYGRAKDAIAQMRPTDQVSFVERYNQLVDQHAHEIGTTLETTTLPNVRDVLQEIRQATVSAGPVAPSVLPSATPSISPTAGDVVPIYTASAVVRETATAVPSTPTQTSARTTTVPVVTPTQSEDASTPSTPSATRGTDRPGTEPPASTSGSRPLQTVTSLPVPSPEPTVSATTPPPTQPSESGTPTVPATPSPEPTVSATTPPPTQPSESGTPTVPVTPRPSDEPSPTSTSGGSTPRPVETSTPRNTPMSTRTPSTEPTGGMTSTPSGEPTISGPVPTVSAEPAATLTVTPPQMPSPGLVPTNTPTALPSPLPDATRTIPPYPGPDPTWTLPPYPGRDATETTLPAPS